MRRTIMIVGVVCAALGFVAILGALVLPWGTYHVHADTPFASVELNQSGKLSLINMDRGEIYLAVLFGACAAFAAAAGGQGWLHRVGGILAVVLGIAGTILAANIITTIGEGVGGTDVEGFVSVNARTEVGSAVGFGLLAPVLVGAAAALVGAARVRSESETEVPA